MLNRLKRKFHDAIDSAFYQHATPYFRFNFTVDQASQLALKNSYMIRSHLGMPPLGFDQVGMRVFSQTDEDGILLYIFAMIGTTNKKTIEIGCGTGIENNTANLVVNHNWHALMIDGDARNIDSATHFYKTCRDTFSYMPVLVRQFVTRDNVNAIIRNHGFAGDVDLLSIDIDGIDYWILDAVTEARPRVIVLEYHNIWGPDDAVTVPYSDDFHNRAHPRDYNSASLPAFMNLLKPRSYYLAGCNNLCFNAFFVREDCRTPDLPEVSPADCFKHPFAVEAIRDRLPRVKDLDWQRV